MAHLQKLKFYSVGLLLGLVLAGCSPVNQGQAAVHPVFDIESFVGERFTDQSSLFRFELESSITKENGNDRLLYTLTITPTTDEVYKETIVTASLDEAWLERLTDPNRNTVYFGTDKNTPILLDRNSTSHQGLITDIVKYVEPGYSNEQLAAYLKKPVKVRLKYQDQVIRQTVEPTRILLNGVVQPGPDS